MAKGHRAQGRNSLPPGPDTDTDVKNWPRPVHMLNQPPVWRRATAKFTESHRATAPEANAESHWASLLIPCPTVRGTIFHMVLSLSFQDAPVKRISMVTTWKAPL